MYVCMYCHHYTVHLSNKKVAKEAIKPERKAINVKENKLKSLFKAPITKIKTNNNNKNNKKRDK